MGLIDQKYPYTNNHELNLDWIIAKISELTHEIIDFKVINQIKFFGTWDITKQYPAWAFVDNGGDGYLSIKPVPAGVDITNEEYWRLVANYSAIYANFQERIIKLERQNNHKYIFIGDSYANYIGSEGKNYFNLAAEYLNLVAGVNYWFTNKAGAGFTCEPGYKFIELLQYVASTMTDATRQEITDIVVCGGANDIGHASSELMVEQAIDDFAEYVSTTFPNAKITLGHFGLTMNITSIFKSRAYTVPAYKSITKHKGKYLINSEYVLQNTNLLQPSDHLHPNTEGVDQLGIQLSLGLSSGSCDVFYNITNCNITSSWPGGTVTSVAMQSMKNGCVSLGAYNNNYPYIIHFDSPIIFAQNHAYELGTFDEFIALGNGYNNVFLATLFVYGNHNDAITVRCYLSETNDSPSKIKLNFTAIDPTYSNTNVTDIVFCIDTTFII